VFAGDDDVVVLAIADQTSTSKSDIVTWINTFGWQVPIGIDSPGQSIFSRYGETRDAFMVFDRDRKLYFKRTGVGNNTPSTTFPKVIDAVRELKGVPVEPQTWGRIKRLLGD